MNYLVKNLDQVKTQTLAKNKNQMIKEHVFIKIPHQIEIAIRIKRKFESQKILEILGISTVARVQDCDLKTQNLHRNSHTVNAILETLKGSIKKQQSNVNIELEE